MLTIRKVNLKIIQKSNYIYVKAERERERDGMKQSKAKQRKEGFSDDIYILVCFNKIIERI